MHFSHLLLLAGTAAAVALPAADSSSPYECCCCDISVPAIVCNPGIPFDQCVCPMVKCPDGAPTTTEILPEPTPQPLPSPIGPPIYDDEEAQPEKRQDTEDLPLPPSGSSWCCCCNGQDNVCSARPLGKGCYCPTIACPDDAETIYP